MMTITPDEIAQYRADLADFPEALPAMEMIEDCEGDLEDAAIALALQVGQEPNQSEQWLDGLAKRWRTVICQAEIGQQLEQGTLAAAVRSLTAATDLSAKLAVPVAIYVLKAGVEDFCRPLQEKL